MIVQGHKFVMNEKIEPDNNNNNNGHLDQDRPISIYWNDLTFCRNKLFTKQSIKLLDNISGCFMTNSLNAVMGPSGAGKTTFLKCLNGFNGRGLSEETAIYLNTNIRQKSCFIVQNVCEHLMEGLTVKQTLLYASKLKKLANNYEIESQPKC